MGVFDVQCLVLCTPNSLLSVRQQNFYFSVLTALIHEERFYGRKCARTRRLRRQSPWMGLHTLPYLLQLKRTL